VAEADHGPGRLDRHFLLSLLATAIIFSVSSFISSRLERSGFADNLAAYGMPLALSALLMHVALEGTKFVGEGVPKVLSIGAGWTGLATPPETFRLFTPLLFRLTQLGLGLAALVLTTVLVAKLARRRSQTGSIKGAVPHLLVVLLLGGLFVGFVAATPL